MIRHRSSLYTCQLLLVKNLASALSARVKAGAKVVRPRGVMAGSSGVSRGSTARPEFPVDRDRGKKKRSIGF